MAWLRNRPTILFYSPDARPVPGVLRRWAEARGFPVQEFRRAGDVESIVLRGASCLIFLDGDDAGAEGLGLVRRLKHDAFTAIVPAVVLSGTHAPGAGGRVVRRRRGRGHHRVLRAGGAAGAARRDAGAHRARRVGASLHAPARAPTRSSAPSGPQLESGDEFAVCYADLDHFKEFNDRYSYYDGDRVIFLLSRILHDVVRGLAGPGGSSGHIGGDDFIFVIPSAHIAEVCGEILSVFDTLIPLQYNDQDRRAGYFFGKDRRGQLHRVPLMTLSIGIVTNRNRRFAHPAQVSELATEMKSYAKTLPGLGVRGGSPAGPGRRGAVGRGP